MGTSNDAPRQRWVLALATAAALAALAALTGCSQSAGATTSSTPTATATPLAVTVPMPDLGPSPAPAPQTPEQTEQLRLAAVEQAWQQVLLQYPSAVRPNVTFEGYTTEATAMDVLKACYTEQGVPFGYGYPIGAKKDAKPTSVGGEASNEKEAIGLYVCGVEHPGKPNSPLTPQQLGWSYDYFTKFLVPCYEANGVVVPPAPSRADFIAKWPNQNWFPTAASIEDPERAAAVAKACPALK